MKKRLLPVCACLAAVLTSSFAVYADDSKDKTMEKHVPKQEYVFPHKTTPEELQRRSTTLFISSGNKIRNIPGKELYSYSKHIEDFAINPSGATIAIVGAEKKHNDAIVISMPEKNEINTLFKLNRKKLGNPQAVIYTPDARRLLVATDTGVHILDARTFKSLSTLPLPHAVTSMAVSRNLYYLAVSDGNKVTVYNIEGGNIRHKWDFDSKVTDMLFSGDNNEFAVLTDDGLLCIYDTRNFLIKRSVDELEGAIACDYNFDDKYMAVALTPYRIAIINLLDPVDDRQYVDVEEGGVADLYFVPDSRSNTLLGYTAAGGVRLRRMNHLTPYYAKLVSDEAGERLQEWMKMMPGESLEEYSARVNDESIARQRRLYEDEISTRLAPDMLAMANVSLGNYDRANGVLAVDFDNMPTIYLTVPENELSSFSDASDLEFHNPRYTVTAEDRFELIYAEVLNKADGKTYVYDNIERVPLNYMTDSDNVVSIELITQQQMEEMRLREIQQKVMEEAKHQNIISEHTNISVDSRIEPDYDADGNKILNYRINFTYEVDPGFTATEDFAPGKYRAEQSGAASAMLQIVKQAFESDFAQYLKAGKKLNVKISGTADATPIVSRIIYDGAYGDFVDEPVYQNGELNAMTLRERQQITRNEELAFLRAVGVQNFLNDNVSAIRDMNTDYRIDINVAEGKGSEYRRITTEFTFVDAF